MDHGFKRVNSQFKSTWDTVRYFGLNSLPMILCLWSPLQPILKLLAIQDHAQNLEEQLWMKGGREVNIISHRCVTSHDLKRERSVFRGSVFDIFASGCSSAHPAKKMKRQKNFAHIFLMLTFPSLFINPPTRYFLMTVLFLNQDCNTLCILIW